MTEGLRLPETGADRDYGIDIAQVLPSHEWPEGYVPNDAEVIEETFARLGYSPDDLERTVTFGGRTALAKNFHDLYPPEMDVEKSRKIMRGTLRLDRSDPRKRALYAQKMESMDGRIRVLLAGERTQ